jgi:hypothetical protein
MRRPRLPLCRWSSTPLGCHRQLHRDRPDQDRRLQRQQRHPRNPLLPTYQQVCATPTQTVTGVYQVYARIYALTTDVKIRLKYQVGDGPFRTLDVAASPVLANGFSEVFLGTITVPDTIGGVKPTWVAIVEENSATLADTCDLNFLRLGAGRRSALAGSGPR